MGILPPLRGSETHAFAACSCGRAHPGVVENAASRDASPGGPAPPAARRGHLCRRHWKRRENHDQPAGRRRAGDRRPNPPPEASEPVGVRHGRSEEHTSALQSLMRTSYAVLCLKKKTHIITKQLLTPTTHIH